jgi:hypothetical protein
MNVTGRDGKKWAILIQAARATTAVSKLKGVYTDTDEYSDE